MGIVIRPGGLPVPQQRPAGLAGAMGMGTFNGPVPIQRPAQPISPMPVYDPVIQPISPEPQSMPVVTEDTRVRSKSSMPVPRQGQVGAAGNGSIMPGETAGQQAKYGRGIQRGAQALLRNFEGVNSDNWADLLLKFGLGYASGMGEAENEQQRLDIAEQRQQARLEHDQRRHDSNMEYRRGRDTVMDDRYARNYEASAEQRALDNAYRQSQADATGEYRDAQLGMDRERLDMQRQQFGYEQAAAERAQAQADAMVASGQLTEEQGKAYNTMVDDYRTDTAVLKEKQEAIIGANTNFDLGTTAGDRAALVTYARVLDPGSVVKEGEVRFSQGSTVSDELKQTYREIFLNDGRLAPELKENIRRSINSMEQDNKVAFDKEREKYTSRAHKFGITDDHLASGFFHEYEFGDGMTDQQRREGENQVAGSGMAQDIIADAFGSPEAATSTPEPQPEPERPTARTGPRMPSVGGMRSYSGNGWF